MKTVELEKATKPLARYAKKVSREPVVVTENGKPLAALIGLTGADWETVSLSNNPKFLDLLERSRTRLKKEGGISMQEMQRRLKLFRQNKSLRKK